MTTKLMFLLSLIISVIISLTMILWSETGIRSENEKQWPSAVRWLSSIIIPLLALIMSLKSKSVSLSGAISGCFIGFAATLSSWCFIAILLIGFITSSIATKYKSEAKRKLESDFKEGGQRDWVQVICNGLVSAEFAICFMLEKGSAEMPINFIKDYNSSWFSIAVLAAFGCSCGDTLASELGTVLSKSDPYLITTLRKVPKGTNGGVSLVGLIVSSLGGCLIGISYLFVIIMFANSKEYNSSPPQWPIIIVGLFSGLFGSLIDSILGSTLQFSGIDKKSGKIVETPGRSVKHINGLKILDNHTINLVSGLITALITPNIAVLLWDII